MKRKVRIFIYALVAWFVGLAVITYDFAVSYAASFNDVVAADWRTFVRNSVDEGGNRQVSYGDYPNDENMLIEGYELSKQYKYTEQAVLASPGSDSYPFCEVFNLSSDSEIVCLILWSTTEEDVTASNKYAKEGYSSGFQKDVYELLFFSKSSIRFRQSYCMRRNGVWAHEASVEQYYNESVSSVGDTLVGLAFAGQVQNSAVLNIKTGSMKTFTDFQSMANYFETGDTSGMAWCGAAPQYDGENIYLNDFQMIVHDSNAYSAYYLEFKYTIPEQLRDAQSLKLQIEEQYDWTITGLSSLVTYPRIFSGNDYVDVLQYPTGFKLYLDDINAIAQSITDIPIASTVSRRAVIGSELAFDTSGVSIGGLGGETVVKVTNSKLYLTCYVVANNKYGVNYSGSVDFVSGSNDMSSYTPDSSGNYKYNGDFKNQGHYFTDVSTDAAGNSAYNYYYYGTDNSRTEITAKDSTDGTVTVVPGPSGSIINNITMPDHIFVSVSGSTGSSGGSSGSGSDVGNVTIEDDDLSFDSLRDSIKDGYGLIDDTDTGVKGDGLIVMLSDLFGYLPAKFVGLIMLGTSSVVGIAVLRMIFKR